VRHLPVVPPRAPAATRDTSRDSLGAPLELMSSLRRAPAAAAGGAGGEAAAELASLMAELESSMAMAAELERESAELSTKKAALDLQLAQAEERGAGRVGAPSAGAEEEDEDIEGLSELLPVLQRDIRELTNAAAAVDRDGGPEAAATVANIIEALESRMALLDRLEQVRAARGLVSFSPPQDAHLTPHLTSQLTAMKVALAEQQDAAAAAQPVATTEHELETQLSDRLAELQELEGTADDLRRKRDALTTLLADANADMLPSSFDSLPEGAQHEAVQARVALLKDLMGAPSFDGLLASAHASVMAEVLRTLMPDDSQARGEMVEEDFTVATAAAGGLAVPADEAPAFAAAEAITAAMYLCLRSSIIATVTAPGGAAVVEAFLEGAPGSEEGLSASLALVTDSEVFAAAFRSAIIKRLLKPFPVARDMFDEGDVAPAARSRAGSVPPTSSPRSSSRGRARESKSRSSSPSKQPSAAIEADARKFHVWGPGRSVSLSMRFQVATDNAVALQTRVVAARASSPVRAAPPVPRPGSSVRALDIALRAKDNDRRHTFAKSPRGSCLLPAEVYEPAEPPAAASPRGGAETFRAPSPSPSPRAGPTLVSVRYSDPGQSAGSTPLAVVLPPAAPMDAALLEAMSRKRVHLPEREQDAPRLGTEASTLSGRFRSSAILREVAKPVMSHTVMTREEYLAKAADSCPLGLGLTGGLRVSEPGGGSSAASVTSGGSRARSGSPSRSRSPSKPKSFFGKAHAPSRTDSQLGRSMWIHDVLHHGPTYAGGYLPGLVADNHRPPTRCKILVTTVSRLSRPPPQP